MKFPNILNFMSKETPPVIAYHGDAGLKDIYVRNLARYSALDSLKHGFGWDEDDYEGCARGCTLGDYDADTNDDSYLNLLGIPASVGPLHEVVYEALRGRQARRFAVGFLKAIPVGARHEHLAQVWPHLTYWMASSLPSLALPMLARCSASDRLAACAENALDVLYRRACGEDVAFDLAAVLDEIDSIEVASEHIRAGFDAYLGRGFKQLTLKEEHILAMLYCLLQESPAELGWRDFRTYFQQVTGYQVSNAVGEFFWQGCRSEARSVADKTLELLAAATGDLPAQPYWNSPAERQLPASITDILATPAPAAVVAKVPELA